MSGSLDLVNVFFLEEDNYNIWHILIRFSDESCDRHVGAFLAGKMAACSWYILVGIWLSCISVLHLVKETISLQMRGNAVEIRRSQLKELVPLSKKKKKKGWRI